MRLLPLLSSMATFLCAAATSPHLPSRDYKVNDYYALHIAPPTLPTQLAGLLGLKYEGPLGSLDHHYVFTAPKHTNNIVFDAKRELQRQSRKRGDSEELHPLNTIMFSEKQELKHPYWKRNVMALEEFDDDATAAQKKVEGLLHIEDPLFPEQWHILNAQKPGNDINTTDVWIQGITGNGVVVCVIDDGLDYKSGDLKDNFFANGSYDFNDYTNLPTPHPVNDKHGTRCAGEIAAGKNKFCGLGVAYNAQISGVRLLSGAITDLDEALAINYKMQENDIYSCSWGPPDDGKTILGPGNLVQKAMISAIQYGRGGKGSIYVFAAGNGAANDDNCSFDGYTNSIYSITVGAIDRDNNYPRYSEACPALLAVTYSHGGGDAIHTTDVGLNECTSQHGGTSAAAPIVAGIYALVLQARPDLTWRDIQWLTVLTSAPPTQLSSHRTINWTKTAVGRMYSPQLGYGKLDAWAIVEMAKNWKLVKGQAWVWMPRIKIKQSIPESARGLSSILEITASTLREANFELVEHVTLTINVEHQRRGDLTIELISPAGVSSYLCNGRRYDDSTFGFRDWTFMSVAYWGESGVGNWTVIVTDTNAGNNKTGIFVDWELRLWGESIESSKSKPIPMPTAHDDEKDYAEAENFAESLLPVPTQTSTPTGAVEPSGLSDDPLHGNPTEPVYSDAQEDQSTCMSTTSKCMVSPYPSTAPNNFPLSVPPKSDSSLLKQTYMYVSLSIMAIIVGGVALHFYNAYRKRWQCLKTTYKFKLLRNVHEWNEEE